MYNLKLKDHLRPTIQYFALLFIMLTSLSNLGGQTKEPMVIDEVIAVVGNTPVLRSELDVLISQIDPDIVVTDELRCAIFRRLLTDKMLVHQAGVDSLPIDDGEVEDKMDNNLRFFERQMNSRANLERYLGMSIGEYKQQMRPKVKSQMLIEKMELKIQSNVKITPKEVRDYYKKIPVDSLPFISAEVEVAQIAIKPVFSPESKEIAREQIELLRTRIMNGESFSKLASLYTKDPGSKGSGGLLPEFGRNDMVPEFERAAFKTKKDSISEIIETKYGYHILKIIDKRGERLIVRHILISPLIVESDLEIVKNKMDTILGWLRRDTISFCKAVKDYSQDDETKANCGFFTDPNLGTQKIPYDYLDKEMSAAIGILKPGEYSEPIFGYAPDGTRYYRILFLKSETKPHVANLEQDWQRIQAMALEAKKKAELDTWAVKKRKDMYISISSHYLNCGFIDEWLTVKR